MARRRSGLFYIRFQEVISHVQEHKRKLAFSGFLAFSIRKEISDRLKTLFPFFVPAAAQYIFAAEKRKNHSQSGFSDCPWSFPVCYDMCIFALYFRYNGNYDSEFFAVLFPIEIGKFFLKLLFFKSPVSEKCPCFRLKWELTNPRNEPQTSSMA